jgi:TonB family protein
MIRTPCLALGLPLIIFAARTIAFAQTSTRDVWQGTPINERVMWARRTHYVPPVYPDLARVNNTQGTVVLHANIDTEGKVVGLQMISGHPLLVRAALEAAIQWRYEQTVFDGQAVQVDTTITIVFSLSDAATAAPIPTASSANSAVILHLQNGRTIHADTSRVDGDKIEYTICEGTYRINKSSVKEIVQGAPLAQAAALPASSALPDTRANPSSNTVTASRLNAMPIPPGEDPANWLLYESTGQLRAECQNGDISKHVHPEFQSTSVFPISKDEEQRECFALNVDMGPDYEQMIDRATQLERSLCTANGMKALYNRGPGQPLTRDEQELAGIEADFHNRMQAQIKQQTLDRTKGLRMLLDYWRLAGTCGHGIG